MTADKETSGRESIPLRNPLYVSGVVSCHVTDWLAQYQHDNFACVKADYVHFLCHMLWFVCVCMSTHTAKAILYSVLCVCVCVTAELLAHCVCSSHTGLLE